VEWVKPIDEVEAEFRKRGVFLLANTDGKLWFFGYKPDTVVIKQMMASMKDRSEEMAKFLIARARAKGETT
jgi:hypothetical protein